MTGADVLTLKLEGGDALVDAVLERYAIAYFRELVRPVRPDLVALQEGRWKRLTWNLPALRATAIDCAGVERVLGREDVARRLAGQIYTFGAVA